MDRKPDNKTVAPQLSMKPLTLQIDQRFSSDVTEEYNERLIAALHEHLRLPEYGSVKIELTLHREGTVIKMLVVEAKSEKNRRYLEKTLSQMQFPALGTGKNENTFILTFCNE